MPATGLALDELTRAAGGLGLTPGGVEEAERLEVPAEGVAEGAVKVQGCATVYGRYRGEEGWALGSPAGRRWGLTDREDAGKGATGLGEEGRKEPAQGGRLAMLKMGTGLLP